MDAPQKPTSITLARVPSFRIGALEVRPATREVIAPGWREVLEPRVMQVLVALARNMGEVMSRDELTALCWNGRIVGDDALNRVVPKLRRLTAREGTGLTLETIRKVGYRLAVSTPHSLVALEQRASPEAIAVPPPRRTRWPLIAAVFSLSALTLWVAFASVGPMATSASAGRQPDPMPKLIAHAAFARHLEMTAAAVEDPIVDAVLSADEGAGGARAATAPAVMTVRPTSDLRADIETPGEAPSASGAPDLGTGPVSFLPPA